MKARLLCVGDLHLGRRPARIPSGLADYSRDASVLGPAAAWRNSVAWAIENEVDAVLLAGDVVESHDDRFEAYGHLERGVQDLVNADIEVFGVVGNHDVEALPRLAERIDGFRLLGKGGRWESVTFKARSGLEIRVLGWSFPSRQYRDNPLGSLSQQFNDTVPTIGLLHCDVEGGKSPYAPVPRRMLERAAVDAWMLGHIHKPDSFEGVRPIGYLGSVVGLDPGEPGMHGPWLAEIEGRRDIKMRQLPMAPLRWEPVELDVARFDAVEEPGLEDALATGIIDAFKQLHGRIKAELPAGSAVGCRVRLTGSSARHRDIRLAAASPALLDQFQVLDEVVYFAESLKDQALPSIDIEQLAQASDPPGLLARRILALRNDTDEAVKMVEEATRELTAFAERNANWSGLGPVEENPFDTRELLLRSGMDALEELLVQAGRRQGAQR